MLLPLLELVACLQEATYVSLNEKEIVLSVIALIYKDINFFKLNILYPVDAGYSNT